MQSRRHFLQQAVLAMAAGGASPEPRGQARNRGGTTVKVAVSSGFELAFAPLLLAQSLGYFTDESLDVQWRFVAGTPEPGFVSMEHHAGVWLTSFAHVLQAGWQGQAVRMFCQLTRSPQVVAGWAGPGAGADRPGVERGRGTWGTVGPEADWVLRLALLQAGGRWSEVTCQPQEDVGAAFNAIERGDLQGVASVDPWITHLEQGGRLQVWSDTRVLRTCHALFGGPVVGQGLVASESFIEQFPEVCLGLTRATWRALRWLQTASPLDLLTHLHSGHVPYEPAVVVLAIGKARETLALEGSVPLQAALNVQKALVRTRWQQADWERLVVTQRFDNRFATLAGAVLRG